MKRPAQTLPATLILLFCLLVVVGISKGLVMAGEKWGQSDIVLAQELPALTDQVSQNQLTKLLTDGYLALAD